MLNMTSFFSPYHLVIAVILKTLCDAVNWYLIGCKSYPVARVTLMVMCEMLNKVLVGGTNWCKMLHSKVNPMAITPSN